jgi:hypothetical protein
MPYIKKEQRPQYDALISDVVKQLIKETNTFDVGELNYVISSIVWKLFDKNPRYKTANDLAGVISCVEFEFQRRKVAIYENFKIQENGDIE